MSQKAEEGQLEITNKVVKLIYEKLPQAEAELLEKFVKQYYLSVSFEDLAERNIMDLYGAILCHWRFIQQRKPGEIKIRVYNPEFEQQGWDSVHTVIELIQEDCPFLLDSIRMALHQRGLMVHMVLHLANLMVERDADGMITNIFTNGSTPPEGTPNVTKEAPVFLEVDRQSMPQILHEIQEDLKNVMNDVRLSVNDWSSMTKGMNDIIQEMEQSNKEKRCPEFQEKINFLQWLYANNFTFLGYCHLEFTPPSDKTSWLFTSDNFLGILKKPDRQRYNSIFQYIPLKTQTPTGEHECLIVGKTNMVSTIHRPANTDLITIMQFSPSGELIGAHCFIGLYTASAYNHSPQNIPLLRLKLKHIMEKANFPVHGHDGKSLLNILENFPRDDLFQCPVDEIYDVAMGILYLQERQKIKIFVLRDTFCHHLSCQVFIPRERFDSALRERIQHIIEKAVQGHTIDFNTRFSESILARIHFTLQVIPQESLNFDTKEIERQIIESARSWEDHLKDAIIEHYGEEKGNILYLRYHNAFPAGYKEQFIARTAVYDIEHMQSLSPTNNLAMSFYRPLDEAPGVIRFKLFHMGAAIPLSDVVPMLENMGLRVIDQKPHEIKTLDFQTTLIDDFGMIHESVEALNVDAVKDVFQEAFYYVWNGHAENDGFNRLVLKAGFNWREVMVLRGYAKYLWQLGFSFSQNYIEETFANNAPIAAQLLELFMLRFDPSLPMESKNTGANTIRRQIKAKLESVENLNEDRIIRRFINLIMATIRTNYFQRDINQQIKSYFSFKIDSSIIPEMPLPKPLCEIFVYSPRMEGVHLRGAKVARGGIRWSDRKEDFRTEVLGLMKAQQVKNAVIVPLGAKGGFICKKIPKDASRDQIREEGVACYQLLIRGLLDLTDNIIDNKIVSPNDVVCYDADDPYLVVAADKGTATFSDIANALAIEHNFWLGDAFASGGSAGYDHKKIGITAKGAWESVKRHFREMGVDTQTQDFTVMGIGDMAGDVFGNGMLLSRHIKLVAAFNHMHIFLDPNPNPEKSFEERKRLFDLERSTWADYNADLISQGGGVYDRNAKVVMLSPEVQACFGFTVDKMAPNDLIRALLQSKVDLLFNGGIGTYVKSKEEYDSQVGDRANDALRINGEDLQCLVVAEGGNLGFTQLGRIEYALKGGRINTDAIDNSAGVDCSDHEVNLKILLNPLVAQGDMTNKQRNELLVNMTPEVVDLVLSDNISQTGALSLFSFNIEKNIDMLSRLIRYLEEHANLDRKLEFLPDNETLQARKVNKQGLTRSELAILFAYTKIDLKQKLLASDLPEDPFVSKMLTTAFPSIVGKDYDQALLKHRLKREIIVMQVANQLIDKMGLNFIQRLQDETGAPTAEIVRAYMVSKEIFDADNYYKLIENLPLSVSAEIQFQLLHDFTRLIRRGARWFLRNKSAGIHIEEEIKHFKEGIDQASQDIQNYLRGIAKDNFELYEAVLIQADIPSEVASQVASKINLFAALDIVEAAKTHNLPIEEVMLAYFMLGDHLELEWFKAQVINHPVATHWDALARASYRDDLDRQQRDLTIAVLTLPESEIQGTPDQGEGIEIIVEAKIRIWMAKNQGLMHRWQQMVAELKLQTVQDFTMYSVAIRELLDFTQVSH